MKSSKFTIIAIGIWILSLSSCSDYLDIIPDDVPTMDLAFSNRQNAERFLATCYSYIPPHGNVWRNPALSTGDEVWNCAEVTYYYSNTTSFRIAKGLQNTNSPYLNYWSGSNDGTNLFVAIRDCNIFLENIEKVPDLLSSERDRWIAEVKVLKAFYHYFLMQLYGPIPIIRENIPVSASVEDVKVIREPVDEVVKYIVELIDEATADKELIDPALPLAIKAYATEMGRLTLPAALAIKAKVLTLAASPLFNGNPDFKDYVNKEGVNYIASEEDPTKWEAARDALKEAIDVAHTAGHELYEFDDRLTGLQEAVSDTTLLELTLRNTITSRFSKELIWGLGNNDVTTLQGIVNAPLTAYHQGQKIPWVKSMHNPTLNVVEQFYTQHGVPINEDKTYHYDDRYKVMDVPENHDYYLIKDFKTAYLNFYREPRYYAYLGFDGGKWFNMEAASDKKAFEIHNKAGQIAGRALDNYSITGYFAKKLVSYKLIMRQGQDTGNTISYAFPIIRLADLYLLYAEALNECKSVPDNEVYEYIQKVRDKAGLDKETGGLVETWVEYSNNPTKPTTKSGMREIIRRERLIELSFEGQRFYDLRRWRLAMQYLNQPIRGWNVSQKDELGYYQVNYIATRRFLLKDYFWPISNADLYKNDKLVQSPQWD
ncbi:RagB/SusD family nutrient uptake outer membrane protein [Proteiniphilum sp.]|uniref:RagB/SusD family nutrient uptake outer membrane protein n=1 Tax=Proteiniphilum sp. TaxID=1926877 RepID=UPI002B1FCAD7|nr:RagB/SusD family nutrient uptake outer membrane protein [Proteiniphilum sp.]MEA4916860.1 RagB/SusD family nutrient uptake outer membrane protein [Proteiniphilum sp.]